MGGVNATRRGDSIPAEEPRNSVGAVRFPLFPGVIVAVLGGALAPALLACTHAIRMRRLRVDWAWLLGAAVAGSAIIVGLAWLVLYGRRHGLGVSPKALLMLGPPLSVSLWFVLYRVQTRVVSGRHASRPSALAIWGQSILVVLVSLTLQLALSAQVNAFMR